MNVLQTLIRVVVAYFFAFIIISSLPVVQLVQKVTMLLPSDIWLVTTTEQRQQATVAALTQMYTGQVASNVFTSAEVAHLADVNRVVIIFLSVEICFSSWIIFTRPFLHKKNVAVGLKRAAKLFAITTIIGGLTFPILFELFHQLLFPHGNYAFPADSLLIQTFPPTFWLLIFILWQMLTVGLLFIYASRLKAEAELDILPV